MWYSRMDTHVERRPKRFYSYNDTLTTAPVRRRIGDAVNEMMDR